MTESYSRFLEGSKLLRRPSFELPTHRIGRGFDSKRKLEHLGSVWYVAYFAIAILCLIGKGIVSAPLWDSNTSTYAGLLTVNDYLNVIRYYNLHADKLKDVDKLLLSDLRGIVLIIYAYHTSNKTKMSRNC